MPGHFYYQGTKHTKSNWNVKIFNVSKMLFFHGCCFRVKPDQ
jgi:hypothetical protein